MQLFYAVRRGEVLDQLVVLLCMAGTKQITDWVPIIEEDKDADSDDDSRHNRSPGTVMLKGGRIDGNEVRTRKQLVDSRVLLQYRVE